LADSTWLILIRHAETDWNSELRFQGHEDRALNESGRATMPAVVEELRGWGPSAVYTSDLQRAREMAEATAAQLDIPMTALTELRECSYGEWEGLTLDDVSERFGPALEAWRADEDGYRRGGGESLVEMSERSWTALQSIAEKHPGETVAVFSHSGPVRSAVCRLFDLSLADRYRFQIDNASITVLRTTESGRWQLMLLNQTRHLPADRHLSSPVASYPET
jgi:broad specificity phosphatase PhoE